MAEEVEKSFQFEQVLLIVNTVNTVLGAQQMTSMSKQGFIYLWSPWRREGRIILENLENYDVSNDFIPKKTSSNAKFMLLRKLHTFECI